MLVANDELVTRGGDGILWLKNRVSLKRRALSCNTREVLGTIQKIGGNTSQRRHCRN